MQNQAKDIYIVSPLGEQIAFHGEVLQKLWEAQGSSLAEVVQGVYPTLSNFIESAFFFATIYEKVNEEKLQSHFNSRIETYKQLDERSKYSKNSSEKLTSVEEENERKLWRDLGSDVVESFHYEIARCKEESWYKAAKKRAQLIGEPKVAISQYAEFHELQEEFPCSSPIGLLYVVESSSGAPGEVSVGITLEEEARGKGFARQAMELVLRWIFDEVGFHRVQAVCLGPPVTDSPMTFFIQMGFKHEGTRRRAVHDANTQKWLDATYLAILDTEWLMRSYYKPAPKTLWDEMFQRHNREREELLCWEGKNPTLKKSISMETITGAFCAEPDLEEDLYASDEESWSEWEKDECPEKLGDGKEKPVGGSGSPTVQANHSLLSSAPSLHAESEPTLRPADTDQGNLSPPHSETWSSDGFDLDSGNESGSEGKGLHSASEGSESAWEVMSQGDAA